MVTLDGESIGREVDWDEAITLHLISDFVWSARESGYRVVRKRWQERYMRYVELEHKKPTV